MNMQDEVRFINQYYDKLYNNKKLTNFIYYLYDQFTDLLISSFKEHEPIIVEEMTSLFDGKSFKDENFRISINSSFIHGKKSIVEYDKGNKKIRCELGDIIFITSFVFNNKIIQQKLTITQIKKTKSIFKLFSSKNFDNQLYLLSDFPPFKSISGILPKNKLYNLNNYSKCLGTHGIICPYNFILISSKLLNLLYQNKSKILYIIDSSCNNYLITNLYRNQPNILKLYNLSKIFKFYYSHFKIKHCFYLNNLHFIKNFIRGQLGELIYYFKIINPQVFNLYLDILKYLKMKRMHKLYNSLTRFNYYNKKFISFNNGVIDNNDVKDDTERGIGIFHLLINLKSESE